MSTKNRKKTVFITGSSSGIGKATAVYFAKNNWNVVATMRTPNEFSGSFPQGVLVEQLDVTDINTIQSAIDSTKEHFGTIDAVINNAGYGLIGPFEESTADSIRSNMDVNFFGMQHVIRAVLPIMREQQSGTIVNISSVVGRIPFPFFSTYSASKYAVEGFSLSLQYELEQFGIAVKLIEPGSVKTDFFARSLDAVDSSNSTPYTAPYKKILTTLLKRNKNGASPESIARCIYTAAMDGKKKLRYIPSNEIKLFIALRTLLPTRLFRKIMKRTV